MLSKNSIVYRGLVSLAVALLVTVLLFVGVLSLIYLYQNFTEPFLVAVVIVIVWLIVYHNMYGKPEEQ